MIHQLNSNNWHDRCCKLIVKFNYRIMLINRMTLRKLIRLFGISLFVFMCEITPAQKVFSVNYENQADVKVYVVNYENQADLLVYKVKYENQAGNNDGKWFFTQYENQAEKKIYFVDYENQADIKIYFVEYENQAGWKNREKMHWMF